MTAATPEPVAAPRIGWWAPVLVLLQLVLGALLLGTVGYLVTSLGVLTGCTSEPVPDVEALCAPAERWLLAGPVGQGLLVVAALVAMVVAVRRPRARLPLLWAAVVALPVSFGWTVLVSLAASSSYRSLW